MVRRDLVTTCVSGVMCEIGLDEHGVAKIGTPQIGVMHACTAELGGDELIACEIRTALLELGKVAGAVYTDDVLDRIFSRFCIGK